MNHQPWIAGLFCLMACHAAHADCAGAKAMPQNGTGKFIDGKGCYEGEVLNGKLNGFGKRTLANESMLVGHFKDSLLNGPGEIYSKNNVLRGEFLNGKLYGFGTSRTEFIDPYTKKVHEVEYYEGNWVNGRREGFGFWAIGAGVTYSGEFENDRPKGYGEYFHSMLGRYVGPVKPMSVQTMYFPDPSGWGTLWDRNGMVFEGTWRGFSIKKGTAKYVNGDVYTGTFTRDLVNGRPENLPDGLGELKKVDGTVLKGKFKLGSFVQ